MRILPNARIGEARINASSTVYSALVLSTFNDDGTYNKTDWEDKQLITEQLMDKIEDAIWCNTNDILKKFDDVVVEQNGAINTLTFYSNGNPVKEITLTSIVPQAGTLSTSYESYSTVSEKDVVSIPYVFDTENVGNATLYVDIVCNASTKTLQYVINKVGAGSANLGILSKGINYISMYAVDALNKKTNIINLTVVCGALEISSTFDDSKDYANYDNIQIPYTVSALDDSDTMTLNVTINGTVYEYPTYNGHNVYTFPSELKTVGVHYVSLQVVGTGFTSNILNYTIIIASNTDILLSVASQIDIQEGYDVEVPYRVSMIGQTMFDVKFYINDVLYSSGTVPNGKNTFKASYRDFTLGQYGLRIEASTTDGVLSTTIRTTINITNNSFKRIPSVTGGLQAYFDMSLKSNTDNEKTELLSQVAMSDGTYAKLVLHDYNYATNGWIDGRLVSNGKAYAVMENYIPLSDNIETGFTFDILFSSNNVGDNDARVIDCFNTGNTKGFYIDSEKAIISTESGNKNKTYYTDKTDMRVTFVVNRTSTYLEEYIIDENGHSVLNPHPTYKPNPMVQTYIDGVLTEVFMLSDDTSGAIPIYENIQHK